MVLYLGALSVQIPGRQVIGQYGPGPDLYRYSPCTRFLLFPRKGVLEELPADTWATSSHCLTLTRVPIRLRTDPRRPMTNNPLTPLTPYVIIGVKDIRKEGLRPSLGGMLLDLKIKKPCTRCGAATVKDEEGRKCTACGSIAKNPQHQHKYIEGHSDDIVKDYFDIGARRTMAKWRICSSSLYTIIRRHPEFIPDGKRPPSHRGPKGLWKLLPAWRDDWPEAVQLRWLDTYSEIIAKCANRRPKDDEEH